MCDDEPIDMLIFHFWNILENLEKLHEDLHDLHRACMNIIISSFGHGLATF
jgi:hypothetical protein